jgi:EAL and modified HD-GYP domain-containing signal transduction protein
MLAEKIETYEEFKHATDMGFEFFQGYFFCKPELMSGKKITGSQLSLLRIVAEVNKADVNVDIIETLVTPDVSLSYKLLRYINSAFFTKANPIESIKQALVYMGENEIRRFISLVAMDDLAADKPPELARTACIRGKFCELIARESALKPSVNELFTLGIFSLIDAIVDQPMPKVMEELPLSERIKQALVRRQGDLTVILVLVETYEKGDWTHVAQLVKLLKINQNTLPSLYLQACRWSTKLLDAKHASDE